jgi:formate hydrogenlyase subunit 3/multisubunit Na+/H+ antiporter MnhD subunit
MWAAIEATTLASAPLIYFYRKKSALEATWKYLLICSVGIALALLGTFFLGIAASGTGDGAPPLVLDALQSAAPHMARPWLKVAFIVALIGYGTKMGLAPMHTWLPDAHSQAPSPVSALLSGALLNCAFLGVLRFYQVVLASGDAAFARTLLLVFGFISIGLAAAFMIGQRDYKRLFAYSSVENMGILAVGACKAEPEQNEHRYAAGRGKRGDALGADNLFGGSHVGDPHGIFRQQVKKRIRFLVGVFGGTVDERLHASVEGRNGPFDLAGDVLAAQASQRAQQEKEEDAE